MTDLYIFGKNSKFKLHLERFESARISLLTEKI